MIDMGGNTGSSRGGYLLKRPAVARNSKDLKYQPVSRSTKLGIIQVLTNSNNCSPFLIKLSSREPSAKSSTTCDQKS